MKLAFVPNLALNFKKQKITLEERLRASRLDMVVCVGLINNPELTRQEIAEEYVKFEQEMEELDTNFVIVPGPHDDRELLKSNYFPLLSQKVLE